MSLKFVLEMHNSFHNVIIITVTGLNFPHLSKMWREFVPQCRCSSNKRSPTIMVESVLVWTFKKVLVLGAKRSTRHIGCYQVRKVLGALAHSAFICQQQHFVGYTLTHWKPMQLTQSRSNVVALTLACNDTSSIVLTKLDRPQSLIIQSIQESVTVVHFGGYRGVNERPC